MWVLDRSNEAPGHTDNNAKNLNSLWCTVAEKIKKKPKTYHFSKKNSFVGIFS